MINKHRDNRDMIIIRTLHNAKLQAIRTEIVSIFFAPIDEYFLFRVFIGK